VGEAGLQYQALLLALSRSTDDLAWRRRLLALPGTGGRLHVAVMHEPYLSLVITGAKSIESRFSRNRVAPYGYAQDGDVVALKRQSGPVVALAWVKEVRQYELDAAIRRHLRASYAGELCAEDDHFWRTRQAARFATLLWLYEVLEVEPLNIVKRDRRGWVALDGGPRQIAA